MERPTKLIDGESLTAYERWELPNVETAAAQTPPKESEPVEPEEVAPLTAQQIEEIQKQAHDEGFELGRKEGLKAGQKEIRAEVQRLTQVVNALANPLAEVDERVENELTQLAITIARQLIRRELHTDPGQVVALVRECIAALPAASRRVQIRLHPQDAALVHEHMSIEDAGENWKVVEDPSLTRGGCRVTAEHSEIDATVERRLNTLLAELLGDERSESDAAS